jgi:hypothetical protein
MKTGILPGFFFEFIFHRIKLSFKNKIIRFVINKNKKSKKLCRNFLAKHFTEIQ